MLPTSSIVDEAHTCAADVSASGTKHQRYELLRGLAADADRHLILVTATPHSGNEGAFRSLLGLVDARFADLPDDERISDTVRTELARHFVQRRRADIRAYLDTETPFPDRLDLPEDDGRYNLTPVYRAFVDDVLAWARETVSDESGSRHRQRVRWWSVLALLRSLASSPAAAAATLRNRAAPAQTTTVEEADDVGRRSVLDQDEADDAGRPDAAPGADAEPEDRSRHSASRKWLEALADQRRGPRRQRRREARPYEEAHQAAARRGLPADRVLPIHPDRRLRRRTPSLRARQKHRGRGGHWPPASCRTREPRRRPRRPQTARAGRHRLPLRGHQSARPLRRGRALRPALEPNAPRTTRGPGRPVRTTLTDREGRNDLRGRQRDR